MRYPSVRSWVSMRSESTRFLGHPRLTNPTVGALLIITAHSVETDRIVGGQTRFCTHQTRILVENFLRFGFLPALRFPVRMAAFCIGVRRPECVQPLVVKPLTISPTAPCYSGLWPICPTPSGWIAAAPTVRTVVTTLSAPPPINA